MKLANQIRISPLAIVVSAILLFGVSCSDNNATADLPATSSSSAAAVTDSQPSEVAGGETSVSDTTLNQTTTSESTVPSSSNRLLVFSETQDYVHASIPAANSALLELTTSAGYSTDLATDSTGVFTETNLANYDAVIFLLTTGDVLERDEQLAFESYIQAGGGFVGIHSASDTEYEWPWYGDLVGAYFDSHSKVVSGTQNIEDGTHLSTSHLIDPWVRTDEWYNYRKNPRSEVNVLLTLDESTYEGGTMGDDHPSAWYHEYDGGRSWYTGGGHTNENYSEPDFLAHILGGIQYAAG